MGAMLSEVKERGILYSAPMAIKVLSGEKTQTRRILKLPDWVTDYEAAVFKLNERAAKGEVPALAYFENGRVVKRFSCPYGGKGDRLWGRETWQHLSEKDGDPEGPCYRATGHHPSCKVHGHLWRPSIFMPRWASRLLSEVVAVRIERLWSISEADAIAEGVPAYFHGGYDFEYRGMTPAYANYRRLWSEINGAESWDANPWVWVVSFRPAPPC